MSAPSARSLAFRQGLSFVEIVLVESAVSHEAASPIAEFTVSEEPNTSVPKDQPVLEPPRLRARDLELHYAIDRFMVPLASEFLDASASSVDPYRPPPKKIEFVKENELVAVISPPPQRDRPKPTAREMLVKPSKVPIPVFRESGIVDKSVLVPLKTNQPPSYPLFEHQNGIEGRVVLRLTVEPDGSVSAVEVEQSSGVEGLDRAAIAAANAWLFEPSEAPMHARSQSLLAPIRFTITSE
jgi:protein TonB